MFAGVALAVAVVSGCGADFSPSEGAEPINSKETRIEARPGLFGEEGLSFGGAREGEAQPGGGGIGVNSFLWRASLDTIAFMPVNSADPFGGVILTDWYAPPGSPYERFKLNVYILDRQLRADGIRVAVFRQIRDPAGEWIDAAVAADTAVALEDTILTRAREIRVTAAAVAP
ncbi:MAG: DUF3576 domain-containing protein [Alphaproteobacteria bacterium]